MMRAIAGIAGKIRLILEVLRSPRVSIDVFGSRYSRETFEQFVSRHPRMPLFRLKTFGVELRDMAVPTEALFSGSRFELLRRKVRKAERLGYTVRRIGPADHAEEILAINRSAEMRQGERLPPYYVDEAEVRRYHLQPGHWFGVFDADGRLRAYCHAPIPGDFFLYSTILGDAARLDDGIMYLLVAQTTAYMHGRLLRRGYPRWAMYDMHIGGQEGLRQFKRRTGFRPARVSWRWREQGAAPAASPADAESGSGQSEWEEGCPSPAVPSPDMAERRGNSASSVPVTMASRPSAKAPPSSPKAVRN